MKTTKRTTGRPSRSDVQADVAREAERLRVNREDDVDQTDIARAIGSGPTHVQHCLSPRERPTFTLADVVLMHGDDRPAVAAYGADLVRLLARLCGMRVVDEVEATASLPVHTTAAVAHAAGAASASVAAMADGEIDEREDAAIASQTRAARLSLDMADGVLAKARTRRLRAVPA